MQRTISLLYLIAFFLLFSTSGYPGWEIYDDFNSGTTINEQKWNIRDSSGLITIENQKAKFVHAQGHPNDSLYLIMNDNTDNIAGIKATVTVESCTGDVSARIGGYSGKVDENHIWSSLQLQDSMDRIYSSTGLEGPSPDYTWVQDLHYAQFKRPITIEGNTYTVSMLFSDEKITYEVIDGGKIEYIYPTAIQTSTDFFRAIGTRSSNGDGPCTVYFDDVYVYRP
jgi:hypothetical protein